MNHSFRTDRRPSLISISSAYDSQYDHPHDETLERLAAHDSTAYWTGTHGTTVAVTNGSTLTMQTHHEAPTEPTALRDGDEADADPADPVDEREQLAPATLSPVSPVATPIQLPGGATP